MVSYIWGAVPGLEPTGGGRDPRAKHRGHPGVQPPGLEGQGREVQDGARHRALEAELRAYIDGPRAVLVKWARLTGLEGEDPDLLLVHYRGGELRPYGIDSLGNLLMDLGARAGVPFSAHDMRRTCATELAERDVAIEVIQDAMGHENLESTRKYVQVRQGRLHAAMDGYQGAVCGETGNGDGHGNP